MSEPTMAERECREFALRFPTPSVFKAIALAEAGRVQWGQVHGLFLRVLAESLDEMKGTDLD
jgi:hypothetical protein